MTSYFIVDKDNLRLYSGTFADTRAFAEQVCASSLDTVLYQIRFRGSEALASLFMNTLALAIGRCPLNATYTNSK